MLPWPVPQLVLRDAGHEHDDGRSGAPFKVLLGHALVRDEKGEEMHKSKGNAIPFEGAAKARARAGQAKRRGWRRVAEHLPPMGADLMRWLFCRHNPVNNINFGPGPAEELRSKFVLKLWNTYAFFCNYARLDGFDPAAAQVPVQDRPDIDRWILSDLQLLIADGPRRVSSISTCRRFAWRPSDLSTTAQQLVHSPQSPAFLEERQARTSGRVSDAVHRADDVDQAVCPDHAVPDGGDVPELWSAPAR